MLQPRWVRLELLTWNHGNGTDDMLGNHKYPLQVRSFASSPCSVAKRVCFYHEDQSKAGRVLEKLGRIATGVRVLLRRLKLDEIIKRCLANFKVPNLFGGVLIGSFSIIGMGGIGKDIIIHPTNNYKKNGTIFPT